VRSLLRKDRRPLALSVEVAISLGSQVLEKVQRRGVLNLVENEPPLLVSTEKICLLQKA
jgi:hypothetical protein